MVEQSVVLAAFNNIWLENRELQDSSISQIFNTLPFVPAPPNWDAVFISKRLVNHHASLVTAVVLNPHKLLQWEANQHHLR